MKNMVKKRQLNFELLRIYSMFFIVYIHMQINLQTQIINDTGLLARAINAFFTSLSAGAVDCFVMISGYFLISAKGKISRLMKTFAEVLFYSILFTVIAFIFGRADIIDLVKSFFPIAPTKFSFWFVTNYMALLVIQPFLSRAVANISKKQYKVLLTIIILINCELVPGFPLGELYSGSFKLLWFVGLFYIGGYIKLFCKPLAKQSRLRVFLILILLLIVHLSCNMFVGKYIKLWYNSLITISIVLCTFRLVESLNIQNSKVISFLAPNVFAVYIIYQHRMTQDLCNEFLPRFSPSSIPMQSLYMISIIILVFLLCVLIDKCRMYLFEKFGINNCLNKIANKIEKATTFDKIF